MIDFCELSPDGTTFEQLIREILLFKGLRPVWTGKGPDQGRDIIAEEFASGPIAGFNRRWLVQCKHFAHGNRSVGNRDLPSIIDDCRQAGVDGYLLACSTQPSSSLVQKLHEISANPKNNLLLQVWDGIHIEKLINEPWLFSIGHIFFPKSFALTKWRVYNMGSPSHWAAHYRDNFMYLACRSSMGFPSLNEIEVIIEKLENVKPLGEHERLRMRAVYYDNKNQAFSVFVDYVVPSGSSPLLTPTGLNEFLKDGYPLYDTPSGPWYNTHWYIGVQEVLSLSDYYHLDDKIFYQSYIGTLSGSLFTDRQLGFMYVWPTARKAPPIRSWSDRLMYERSIGNE